MIDPGNPSSALAAMMEHLLAGETVIIDGATGSEIERRGAKMNKDAWCSTATLTHPEILQKVHEDYIRAGAKLITANTFSTNRTMLGPAGLGKEVERVNRAAVKIASAARSTLGADNDVVIAGSMSHQEPRDANGVRIATNTTDARENFHEMADILASAGVDLLILEMMCIPEMANLAIEAARNTGLPFWVGFSVRANAQEELESYVIEGLSAEAMFNAIDITGAQVAGIMHSKANITMPALAVLRTQWDGPLMAYPDSGYFKPPHWQFVDIISTAEFVRYCHQWREGGVKILGGCCGLGIEHIEALIQSL